MFTRCRCSSGDLCMHCCAHSPLVSVRSAASHSTALPLPLRQRRLLITLHGKCLSTRAHAVARMLAGSSTHGCDTSTWRPPVCACALSSGPHSLVRACDRLSATARLIFGQAAPTLMHTTVPYLSAKSLLCIR